MNTTFISKIRTIGRDLRNIALTGGMLAVAYTGVTVAANATLAGAYAAQEGIERLCGAETREVVATLKPGSTRQIQLPTGHGRLIEGIFTLKNGVEVTVLDAPVITAGKYWPGMNDLVEGQNYRLTTFDGFGGHRFVKADKQ